MIWRKAGRCGSILESFNRQPCTLPSSPCHGDAGIIQALQRYIEKSRSHASSFIKNACGETFSLPSVGSMLQIFDFVFQYCGGEKKTPLFQAICLTPFFYGKRQWLSKYKMLKRDLQIKDEQKSEAYISKLVTVALSCSSRIRSLRPTRGTQ